MSMWLDDIKMRVRRKWLRIGQTQKLKRSPISRSECRKAVRESETERFQRPKIVSPVSIKAQIEIF